MRLAILFLLLVPLTVSAGNATGKITGILVSTDSNVVVFKVDTPLNETPRCNKEGQFAFDVEKPGGRSMLNSLFLAYELETEIKVSGRNICQIHWQSEDVRYIALAAKK